MCLFVSLGKLAAAIIAMERIAILIGRCTIYEQQYLSSSGGSYQWPLRSGAGFVHGYIASVKSNYEVDI